MLLPSASDNRLMSCDMHDPTLRQEIVTAPKGANYRFRSILETDECVVASTWVTMSG